MTISMINGLIYGLCWFVLVIYGSQGTIFIPLLVASGGYFFQLALFAKLDREKLAISIPLSIFALILGFFQEVFFIQFNVLQYPNKGFFAPLWLLALYPLFSLTLNASLNFLNRSLILAFFLGGFGGLFSYISGEKLGAMQLNFPLAYPVLFFSWGLFLTLLILLNRLIKTRLRKR